MDPLSIAAAIAGFLSLAGQIATMLKSYVGEVQSAPDEVQGLLSEITALRQVLRDFMMLLGKDDLNGRKFESNSVLVKAIEACQYQLEELRGRLAGLTGDSSNRKLPGWVTRMKWPLKKDEIQRTMVSLQRFAQIFQFSMVIRNCQLMSGTSSAVILQLDENGQEIENIAKNLESLSISVPSDLQQKISEFSEIKAMVSELAQFNIEEVQNISLGMSDVQQKLQDITTSSNIGLKAPENVFYLNRSLVIDHLDYKFSSEERVCVACLYCDYQDDKAQTTVNMIGVLLKQVITRLNKSGSLPLNTITTLREYLNEHKNVDLLEACRLLGETAKQLRRFYVCIDALDECNEEHRGDLIQALAKVERECNQRDLIRIFFTTRPHIKWPELMERNCGLGPLDYLVVEAHPDDIRKYVLHRIEKDGNSDCMDDKLKDEILERIMGTCDRMFLLPALQIQAVLDQTTISKRRKALSEMPIKLEMAFESTISRIKNKESERSKQAMDVLKWSFLARCPLTVMELRHALSVEFDPSEIRHGNLPLAYDKTLDWDNFPSDKSLTDWCLGLIIVDEETSTVRLVHKSLHDYLMQLNEDSKIFHHGHTEIAFTCLQYMRFNDDERCGLENSFKNLLDGSSQTVDFNTKLGGSTMLLQASCVGNVEIVRLLLRKNVNVNLADGNGRTALSWASKNGHDSVLWASTEGHSSVVKLLLQSEFIDINSKDNCGWTALLWASEIGHDSVIDLLLQSAGIDINLTDKDDRTALAWASRNGHDSSVKLLLQTDGIKIDPKDQDGRTAL
ncbi:hypothetical protein BZA77DRAFT_356429 [Pyronema omphalodes]|nr:hypothetical protein BZA77DRAFT_356429 [Pyronema omphalodes]